LSIATAPSLEETARAKVNLALHVLGRRLDGYHLLDSIVVFADLCDRLTFSVAESNSLSVTGPHAAGLGCPDDLILKAQEAMAAAFGQLIPGIAVKLEKNIPLASGLGGGSADAAATLRALCRFARLDPKSRAVREIALSLGADVPVCLSSLPSRMGGIGELLEPLPEFPPLNVVLANAGPVLATPQVFAGLGLEPGETGYPPLVFPFAWETSRNDLTPPAIERLPVIALVLDALKASAGVRFARMSGSGGTCFAVFDGITEARAAAAQLAERYPDWWIRPALLS
jgi:4-diphosphocytidyl-2-C-methyl-D-erythritol kinase